MFMQFVRFSSLLTQSEILPPSPRPRLDAHCFPTTRFCLPFLSSLPPIVIIFLLSVPSCLHGFISVSLFCLSVLSFIVSLFLSTLLPSLLLISSFCIINSQFHPSLYLSSFYRSIPFLHTFVPPSLSFSLPSFPLSNIFFSSFVIVFPFSYLPASYVLVSSWTLATPTCCSPAPSVWLSHERQLHPQGSPNMELT